MKKISILMVFLLSMLAVKVYAETPTLEQIVDKFNNSSAITQYASYGSIWKATSTEDKINVSVTTNETTSNVKFTLMVQF